MRLPHSLTLDQKFELVLAIAQERRDAKRKAKSPKPECRDKPVVSRTGRVVKPATVQCGSVCRQKQNCKITKKQLDQVRRQMPNATKREVAEAIKKAMAKKRQGMGTAGALYEGTKGARGARGNERLAQKKRKAQEPSKPPSKESTVRLGKPIHARVTTPEEAIANGRAILGDLIGRLAQENEATIALAKAQQRTGRKPGLAGERENLSERIERLRKRNFRAATISKLEERLDKLGKGNVEDNGIENATSPELRGYLKAWGKSLDLAKKNHKEFQRINDSGNYNHAVRKYEEDIRLYKLNIEKATKMLKDRDIESKQRAAEAMPTATAVIKALMDRSPISAEEALELAKKVVIKGKVDPDTRQQIADVIRLTNGQCLETLGEVKVSKERAHASKGSGYVTFDGSNFQTLFHEMGHHLEFADHNAREQVGVMFVEDRATGPRTRLNKMGQGKYGDDEMAYPDHFISPYVGKIYDDGDSEVISMGLQNFSHPASLAWFAAQDPDHLALVVGVMQQQYTLKGAGVAEKKQATAQIKKQVDSAFQSLKKVAPKPISLDKDTRRYPHVEVKNRRFSLDITLPNGDSTNIQIGKRHQPRLEAILAARPDLVPGIVALDFKDRRRLALMVEDVLANLEYYKDRPSDAIPDQKHILLQLGAMGWDVERFLKESDFLTLLSHAY